MSTFLVTTQVKKGKISNILARKIFVISFYSNMIRLVIIILLFYILERGVIEDGSISTSQDKQLNPRQRIREILEFLLASLSGFVVGFLLGYLLFLFLHR